MLPIGPDDCFMPIPGAAPLLIIPGPDDCIPILLPPIGPEDFMLPIGPDDCFIPIPVLIGPFIEPAPPIFILPPPNFELPDMP